MSLKPCLMMSPLSVSLFLQGDSYNFDIVIFDEASQVCTEDAIGAIIRGKQVVIAGDSKQLPPTNFFSSITSDSDFDSFEDEDESYEDIDGYESILDEAVTVLPERSLKWHYRSRHEHLIAFSNAKIYNNNLITFPSSVDKMPDNGVEYVYVENGVYDRGGKKNNIIEAKKVAELVFKHIKNHPNRSLGVVTFSESQQQAVETIIRQMRINNQEYENFFNEEKEEAFFVKNLENVQGDERDTIIFSIGYAKDSNGLMYMNFGPLSKSGGYRRLNVAITRAKYNIKLVGSIRPTDINIDKTNSKGVKMLRSYIEFAINGMKALEQENICPNSVEVESPFEEAVYDFLVEKGFLVSTQVGCSEYRIDIAIRHPQLAGRFVLGIECDGATYHSARTARERDRLRQSILEDMGWKIYRIWSTDWIKDPVTEGAKLVEIVNKAILEYEDDDSDYFNKNNEENVQCNIENEFVEIEEEKDEKEISNEEKNIYGFNWYEEADIYSVNKQGSKSDYLANVIKFVIETEQPIHFEQLCKRLAPLFGNQKATIKVRNSAKNIINLKLKNEVYIKNKFCFLNSDKPINVRIPKSNKNCRQINFISIEELSRAMYVIASKGFGITQNDLFVITARTFGFQRIGDNITQAMKNAFKYLIDIKKVIIINGKVVCDSSYGIKQEKKSI
ncbi:AAA domain-containing protein [Clostridium sp. JNZ X4-2]